MNKIQGITWMQYILIIHGAQVGVGITTLPRQLAEVSGTDGWITILLGWVLTVLASIFVVLIMQKYPNDTIFELLKRYFGRIIGSFLGFVVILYAIFVSVFVLANSVFIVKTWVLPQTHFSYLVFLFAIPVYFIAKNGITVIGRYSEIVFYLTSWLILILIFTMEHVNWPNLLPIVKEGWAPIITGVPVTVFSFVGFELAFLLYPFLMKKNKAIKAMIVANSLTLFSYLFITLICFIFYSPYEITSYQWPPISLLKVIELPLLERFEVPIMSFYLLVFSTTVIPYLFFAMHGASHLLNKGALNKTLGVFLLILFIISIFFSPTYTQLEELMNVTRSSLFAAIYLFPILLWIYGLLTKGRSGNK